MKQYIWAASWQNQQNGMCAQRRLWSDWASAQSEQSLRCPHEESLGPYLPIKHTAKTHLTGRMPRLICAFPGHTVIFVGFVMGWLISRIIYTSWDWGESETQLWKTSVAIKPFSKAQFHKKGKKQAFLKHKLSCITF